MSKLSENQIKSIADRLAESNIESRKLIEDLTDHICCLIEDDLKTGNNIEEAEKRAFETVFPKGIKNEYSKSLILLSSRRSKRMKSLILRNFLKN